MLGGNLQAASEEGKERPLRILVVEDDDALAGAIREYLRRLGHNIEVAKDGGSGITAATTEPFDILILDLTLPVMDGLTVCDKLQKDRNFEAPILMLTGRSSLEDKLAGFNAGADDYLTKPFSMKELVARIQALVRRREREQQTLEIGDLEIDVGARTVSRSGKPVKLNRACFSLLLMLVRAAPNVVDRQELAYALWGDIPPGSDSLRTHICTLRKAIDKDFDEPLLETVHGVGYRIRTPNDSSV